jgi:hypothetical protein
MSGLSSIRSFLWPDAPRQEDDAEEDDFIAAMKAISDSLTDHEETNAEGKDVENQGTIEQGEEAQEGDTEEDKSKDGETQ